MKIKITVTYVKEKELEVEALALDLITDAADDLASDGSIPLQWVRTDITQDGRIVGEIG